MRNRIIFILLIILCTPIISSCSSEINISNKTDNKYQCPNLERLEYDNNSNTYIMWTNCMPSPDNNRDSCGPDKEYESWVNNNCNINFKYNVAY